MTRLRRRTWSASLLSLAILGAGCVGPDETATRQSGALSQAPAASSSDRAGRARRDPDVRKYPTGRRELTAEEQQQRRASRRSLTEIRPTSLALTRLRDQAARQPGQKTVGDRGLSVLETSVAAPGADLKTAPAPSSTTASGGPAATIATITSTVTAAQLPAAVDNSTLKGFPEIRTQGGIGSCVAFSVAYYQYTHELALLTDWDNRNAINTTKISPKWAYNLANGGSDNGTDADSVYDIIERHGALTWTDFPYSGDASIPVSYLEWPRGAATWTNALQYRGVEHGSLPVPTDDASMQQVKNVLLNGHVLSFSTFVYGWVYDQLDNDPNTTADDVLFNAHESIATWVDGQSGGHEMTIVGYNDDLWVDLNGNGLVEVTEKGAFKIANSWGNDWQNLGFVWLAYDALNMVSRVPGGPAGSTRRPAIGEIYWVTARANYQPTVIAELTLSAAQRNTIYVTPGVTELDRATPFMTVLPQILRGNGGAFAFDGTSVTQPQTASFAVDLTDVAQSYGDVRYQIGLQNMGQLQATLSGVTIVDKLKGVRTVTADPIAVVSYNENKSQAVRYELQDPAHVPQLVVTPGSVDFGSVSLGASTSRTLMLQNSGTGDAILSSLRFDAPLFFTTQALPLRVRAGETTSINLQFAPAAGQSETASLDIRSNNASSNTTAVPLAATGTSTNDSAPFLVYVRQQNDLKDNSIAMRFELVSHAPMPARISNYKIVYYINEPNRDLSQLVWETYYTDTRTPIGFKARKIFLTKTLGPRAADTAIELTFPDGTTLYPQQKIVIEGSLHHRDWTWTFDESDDWSRYLRRDGLAENTTVQDVESKNILFGSSPEGALASSYRLTLASPTPVTGDATITFNIIDAALVPSLQAIELYRNGAFFTYFRYSVQATGAQSFVLPMGYYDPAEYTAALRINGQIVDYVTFQKI